MNKAQFFDMVAEEFGMPFAISYIERSEFTGGDHPILYPWSMVANDRLKTIARKFLEREGVKLGPPRCMHLVKEARRAA